MIAAPFLNRERQPGHDLGAFTQMTLNFETSAQTLDSFAHTDHAQMLGSVDDLIGVKARPIVGHLYQDSIGCTRDQYMLTLTVGMAIGIAKRFLNQPIHGNFYR